MQQWIVWQKDWNCQMVIVGGEMNISLQKKETEKT